MDLIPKIEMRFRVWDEIMSEPSSDAAVSSPDTNAVVIVENVKICDAL